MNGLAKQFITVSKTSFFFFPIYPHRVRTFPSGMTRLARQQSKSRQIHTNLPARMSFLMMTAVLRSITMDERSWYLLDLYRSWTAVRMKIGLVGVSLDKYQRYRWSPTEVTYFLLTTSKSQGEIMWAKIFMRINI